MAILVIDLDGLTQELKDRIDRINRINPMMVMEVNLEDMVVMVVTTGMEVNLEDMVDIMAQVLDPVETTVETMAQVLDLVLDLRDQEVPEVLLTDRVDQVVLQ